MDTAETAVADALRRPAPAARRHPSARAAPGSGRRSDLATAAVLLAATLALAGLGACAGLPPASPVAGARQEQASLVLGGREVPATWFVPAAEPRGLLTLQHGFTRRCANLRETGLRLAATGWRVLCLDAEMARGNPALAADLAAALPALAPAGPLVVGGHSAGALFSAQVGAVLAREAPGRLAGALLVDPVDARGRLGPALVALSDGGARPVLAIVAPPGRCNAQGNAAPALKAAGATVLEIAGATHADVEGGDSDAIAAAACGAPQPGPVEALRAAAQGWLSRLGIADAAPPGPLP